ncbi:MAG: VWA domain-containing protein [Gammaproteobacteria bacterium]|nr:VWA domain-containing protein [Gammaproteobacteria bacterium]
MRLRVALPSLLAFVLLFGGGMAAVAQTGGSTIEISDVTITRYPRVQAVVELRNLQTQLNPAQLSVTENGVPVQDLEVEMIGESVVPVGIVLAIDGSGSMQGEPIDAAKQAALSFIEQKRDQDFIALLVFADDVQVLSGFTSSKTALTGRVQSIQAGGETAFYDAVVRGASLFTGDAARLEPNMIVLTDGADTVSVATLDDAIAATESVRVFGVALESPEFNPTDIQAIADSSGGLFLSTPDPAALTSLYDQIKRELDNKVVVRFTATQDQAGPLAIGVAYQGITASTSVDVPGFIKHIPTTTTTVSVAFTQPPPYSPSGESPLPLSTLAWIGPGAVGLGLVLFIFILAGPREEDSASALRNRLRSYGASEGGEERKKGVLGRIFGVFSRSAEEAVRRRGLLSGVNAALEQANVPLRGGEAIAAALGLSLLVGAIVGAYSRSVTWGGGAFLFAIVIVMALIQFGGGREKRIFENQLPDTLILLSTSLRAGYSLLQAVEAVASEAQEPTSREFGRAMAESRLGLGVVDSMRGIAERMQSEDFGWAVMAIEIQREVGGNLAEVLQTVADTMRQRNRLRGEIKALTAEGRISAIVLGALPFVLFAFLFATNRDYLNPLLTRVPGIIAIVVGMVLMGIGVYWLKKIVDIEV